MAPPRRLQDGERPYHRSAGQECIWTPPASHVTHPSSLQSCDDAENEAFDFQEPGPPMPNSLLDTEMARSDIPCIRLDVGHRLWVPRADATSSEGRVMVSALANNIASQNVHPDVVRNVESYLKLRDRYNRSLRSDLPEVGTIPDAAVSPHAHDNHRETEMDFCIDTVLRNTTGNEEQPTTLPSCSDLLAPCPDGERQSHRSAGHVHLGTSPASHVTPLSSLQSCHGPGHEAFDFLEPGAPMTDPLSGPEPELLYPLTAQVGVAHGLWVADAGATSSGEWATPAALRNDVAMPDLQVNNELSDNSCLMPVHSAEPSRTSDLPEVGIETDAAVSPHAHDNREETEMDSCIDTALPNTAANEEQTPTASCDSELVDVLTKFRDAFCEARKPSGLPTLGLTSSDSNPPVCENETASYIEPVFDLGGYAANCAPGHQSAVGMTENTDEQEQSVRGPHGLDQQRFGPMDAPDLNFNDQSTQLSRESEDVLSSVPLLRQNIQKCPRRIAAINTVMSETGKDRVGPLLAFFQDAAEKELLNSLVGKHIEANDIKKLRNVLKNLDPLWDALASPLIVRFDTYCFEIFSAVFETYWKPPLEAFGQTTPRVSDDGNRAICMLWDINFIEMVRARITELLQKQHSALARTSEVVGEMQTELNVLKNALEQFGTFENRWCWHPPDKAIGEIDAWLKYRGKCGCEGERACDGECTRDIPRPHETRYQGIDMMTEDESVARRHSVAVAHMFDCINNIDRDYEALTKGVSVASEQQTTRVEHQAPLSTPAGYIDMSEASKTARLA